MAKVVRMCHVNKAAQKIYGVRLRELTARVTKLEKEVSSLRSQVSVESIEAEEAQILEVKE